MRQETIDVTTSVAIPAPMTRREKLMRWAGLVRATQHPNLALCHLLERWDQERMRLELVNPEDATAFALALRDPVLLDAGLRPEPGKPGTVADQVKFFELTRDQLHEFSCDCGGHITNGDMANRIERIANAT